MALLRPVKPWPPSPLAPPPPPVLRACRRCQKFRRCAHPYSPTDPTSKTASRADRKRALPAAAGAGAGLWGPCAQLCMCTNPPTYPRASVPSTPPSATQRAVGWPPDGPVCWWPPSPRLAGCGGALYCVPPSPQPGGRRAPGAHVHFVNQQRGVLLSVPCRGPAPQVPRARSRNCLGLATRPVQVSRLGAPRGEPERAAAMDDQMG